MRCPDCGADYPVKPEVVVKKEPCRCGVTELVRMVRWIMIGLLGLILMFGSCTAYIGHLNSKLAEKGDFIMENGMLLKPEKK